MRYQELRKKLLTEGTVVAALLMVMGGGLYFLDSMHDNQISQNRTLESQLNAVTNEMNGLREKYIRVQKDGVLYQKIMTMDASDQLSLDSRAFSSAFADFRKRYNLVMGYSGTDSAPLEDPKYKRASSLIEARNVTVNFKALSDEDVYELIQAIQKELPGSTKITSLKLNKVSRLTDQSLRAITKSGAYTMVDGTMDFIWYGIAPSDPNLAKEAKKTRGRRR